MRPDFAALRRVPILHVAQMLGLVLVRTGAGTYAVKEDGEITSLVIFERTNSFYRFSGKERGGVSPGSGIDHGRHAPACSLRGAVEFLSPYNSHGSTPST